MFVFFLDGDKSVALQIRNLERVLMLLCCCFFAFGIGGQDGSLGERRLNSGILGASVANLSIAGLQENVEIVLRNMEPVPVSLSTK